MSTPTSELIKLNNLQLTGKIISRELMLGIHASTKTGGGTEFEQYRHYQKGDDLKRIDWKLYAKTGKHLVKESSTESNLKIKMVLDLSGSMNYTEDGVSRLDFAKIIISSLAYLGYIQGDLLSFFTLEKGNLNTIVPEGKNAFQSILYYLEKAKAAGEWQNETPDFPEFQRKQKEIVIWVSDFLQVNDEWLKLAKAWASPHRQILMIQILGKKEIDFDLSGFYRFKDLESGTEYQLDANSVKKQYKTAFENYLKNIEKELRAPNLHLIRASLQDSVTEVISKSLKALRT